MIEAHPTHASQSRASRDWLDWGEWRDALALPRGDTGARLTLIAFVIALHNLLEAPRDPINQALGQALTGALAFVALSASLALLGMALWARPPGWGWLRSRWARTLALILTLGAGVIGVKQIGVMVIASISAPSYPNDGATLDQYAAQQLLAGHNPYETTDIVAAINRYKQPKSYTTPLRTGPFAGRAWTDYPSAAERAAAFETQHAGDPRAVTGFETRLSYPAMAFLSLVPLVWAGLPSATLLTALCWLTLALLLLKVAPPELRIWVLLLALADVPLVNAAGIADPDVLYLLPLFIAWRWRERGTLSAVTLGLALATKQLAWFSAPFYVVLVWRERGWRAAMGRLAGAGALFVVVNLPFFIASPSAWLAGVLAPETDPMFPLGNGIVRLSLSGVIPLPPASFFTALEALVMVAALVWYWRNCLRAPALGYALAVAPLFVAWRSLTTYFYFIVLPAMALLLPARPAASLAPLEAEARRV